MGHSALSGLLLRGAGGGFVRFRWRVFARWMVGGLCLGLLVMALFWLYGQWNGYALQVDWTRAGYDDRAAMIQETRKEMGWFWYPILFPVQYTPKGKVAH